MTTDPTTVSTIGPTTFETLGTLKSTSTYPIRQAIDECAGICYPGSLPTSTTLSDCTITFTDLKAGVWYAVAIQVRTLLVTHMHLSSSRAFALLLVIEQLALVHSDFFRVEDFIDKTSNTPMSLVPVQMLIYVQPELICSNAPIIFPLDRCLEVQVGVAISFNIFAMHLCSDNVTKLTDVVIPSRHTGMTQSNLTSSPANASISYVIFLSTPQVNQIGAQQLCLLGLTKTTVTTTIDSSGSSINLATNFGLAIIRLITTSML
ncbi:unnamed protein product [Rotaria magnacalcarata]